MQESRTACSIALWVETPPPPPETASQQPRSETTSQAQTTSVRLGRQPERAGRQ